MIAPEQVEQLLAGATKTTTSNPTLPFPTVMPDPIRYETATETGFHALWVVFAIMTIASAAFAGMSWNIPVSRRLYHFITCLITITAALSYFAMASGHGTTLQCTGSSSTHKHHNPLSADADPTHSLHDYLNVLTNSHKHHRHHGHDGAGASEVCREVYWARYVDWSITTPLLLLDLCLLAGMDGAHTLMAIAADVVMILTGLFAALGSDHTAQKWGWYTIACVAYLVVVWHVALHGGRAVRANTSSSGGGVARVFGVLAPMTLLLWTAYPIVWGVADGARKASVDAEILAYAVLDVLAKAVFGVILLVNHRVVPQTNVEVGGYWAYGLQKSEGRIRIGDDEA